MGRRRNIFLLVVLLFWSAFSACDTPTTEDFYPYAPVFLRLNLYSEARVLVEPFSYYVVKAPRVADEYVGLAGVVVVHGITAASSGTVYYAYDLACPHELPELVATEPMQREEGKVRCPRCGTEYDLMLGTGHPERGEGKIPLKAYRVREVERGILEVIH